ncbi:MAG: hypothetical protein AB7O56_13680 [Bauldia sp.]
MQGLSRRIAAFLFAIVAAAFVAHGTALAAGAIGCADQAVAATDRAEAHAHRHGAPDQTGPATADHSACCAQVCAIATPPPPLLFAASAPAEPLALVLPGPRTADPFRIDRPPRALIV